LPDIFKNIVENGLDRLPFQFKTSDNLRDLYSIFLSEIQELSDTFKDISEKCWLNSSENKQLDGNGEILGLSRPANLLDPDYAFYLRIKTMINSCDQRVENTLEILKLIFTNAEIEYICTKTLEATYKIIGTFTPTQVVLMQKIPKTLGVGNIDFQDVSSEKNLFSFFQDPIGKGFGTITDSDVGGFFAKLIV
jgi:hypothetical protein